MRPRQVKERRQQLPVADFARRDQLWHGKDARSAGRSVLDLCLRSMTARALLVVPRSMPTKKRAMRFRLSGRQLFSHFYCSYNLIHIVWYRCDAMSTSTKAGIMVGKARLSALAVVVMATAGQAQVLYSDGFESYAPGSLDANLSGGPNARPMAGRGIRGSARHHPTSKS